MITLALSLLLACGTDATPDTAPADATAAAKGGDHDGHGHGHADGHDGHGKMEAAKGTATADGWTHYGEAFTLAEAADCATITKDPGHAVDQVVRVTGRIENVCQKQGCWMVLADADGTYLRVTMKDHAFGVPTDTATGEGTLADIEGTLIKKELDADTLAHLESEAKGEKEVVKKQFEASYELVATGVSVRSGA